MSKSSQKFNAQLYIEDSGIPWGMAWLPNGDLLITMRGGELKVVKQGKLKAEEIAGLPDIEVGSQGGLLDIVLHPDYANNGWIYMSYAKADGKGNKSTAIMRAKLKGMALTQQEHIYVANAYSDKGVHFGSRLAFDNQGFLYFSIGDRGQRDVNPQDISRDAGKVYRLHADGRIPADNPFVDNNLSKKAIYSYGHRNPQGMAKHPVTGEIWTHEHGPRGGDEVNIIGKSKNYGWPEISYGINYSGTSFTDLTEKEGMEQPLWYWDPSIAPSGMVFVTSDKYPQWQGNVLIGSLKFGYVVMLTLDGNNVVKQEIVKDKLTRVRNIKQGPDGYIYVAVDGQGIYKLVPET
ncbi:PQQ-dependent sugar dehydrogenase [Thalassotalea nanhaiensis]|uniref:PQQ-dependent sugar dehydrogenase n=1 Tax=Thalassotalea nanhaiensis TaxID=3065648 RepID=A0ABY9TG68_9GAMM|nr:PQQ-dependent sugar dehydrogenase [Colwelliaceae bacterium SQ345]